MAMALDEPRDTDSVYKVDEFTYIVDKELFEKAKPIKVDFAITGFKIDSAMDFGPASACSSCSTSGSCST